MADFTTKVNASSPAIQARLKSKDGTTATLTGAAIAFWMRNALSHTVKINYAAATLLAGTPPALPDDPNVEYDFTGSDLDTAGVYEAHFRVTYAGGGVEFFPDSGYLRIEVDES